MNISMHATAGRPVTAGRGRAVRWWVLAALVASLVVGCGSSAGGTSSPDGAGPTGDSAVPTEAAEPTPTESSADGGGDSGGGDTGGGGANLDIEVVARALVPPNSSEISKTTADDTWFVMYETSESIDALKSFYEDAIPGTGLKVYSTTTANGGVSWAMATDESGTFGGAVSIFPSGDGKNVVQVTVAKI
jgi:hypothetical protein